MVAMSTYTVTAERGASSRTWVFQCREHPGAISQGRRLSDARRLMPEAIAFVSGVDPGDVEVLLEVLLPERLSREVESARRAVRELEDVQREVAAQSRRAARELLSAGLSGAEVAEVLQVSPQRVSQLVHS